MLTIVSRAICIWTPLIITITWGRYCYSYHLHLRKLSHRKVNHLNHSCIASECMISGSLTPELCSNVRFNIFFPWIQIPKEKQSWKSEALARKQRQDLGSRKVAFSRKLRNKLPWSLQDFVIHHSKYLWHGHQNEHGILGLCLCCLSCCAVIYWDLKMVVSKVIQW